MAKKTLVLGASENPDRYSHLAVLSLRKHGHPVVAAGRKPGIIGDTEIITDLPEIKDLDTVSMYLNAKNQEEFIAPILSMKPKRIIFNPGAENPRFAQLAEKNGISTEEACTLVLLSTNQF